jgi:response regulator RpfG family c-di-GMP phosphodiesterase
MKHMKYKVLYVDDEESNLRIFKDAFRRDFEVITALSASEALKKLEEDLADVVITDQRMPVMTGVELLREINERFSEIPPQRLILSGFAEDEEIIKAFREYKLQKFIAKPWNYEELKLTIVNSIKEK